MDAEDLGQPGDPEDLEQPFVRADECEIAAGTSQPAVGADQDPQTSRIQEVDPGKVDDDVLLAGSDHLVEAVAQPTKSGFIYLFDRQTGQPLFPIENRNVPKSDLPGEVASETQPFPTLPEPFARQKLTADMLTQHTQQAHDAALAQFNKVRSDGQFVPPSMQGTIIFPGFDGGAEWGGEAFDPESHLFYVNANEMAWILSMVEQKPQSGQVTGKGIYLHECATCHKPNMQGAPPEFPSLVGLKQRFQEDDITAP